jgi:hypothetical protein
MVSKSQSQLLLDTVLGLKFLNLSMSACCLASISFCTASSACFFLQPSCIARHLASLFLLPQSAWQLGSCSAYMQHRVLGCDANIPSLKVHRNQRLLAVNVKITCRDRYHCNSACDFEVYCINYVSRTLMMYKPRYSALIVFSSSTRSPTLGAECSLSMRVSSSSKSLHHHLSFKNLFISNFNAH